MSTVQTIQSEQLTAKEARQVTQAIREHMDSIWKLLLVAHEGKVWKPLGYETWEAYVQGEFDMSRAYSYRLLDQGRVIREIEQAVSPIGDIPIDVNEHRARRLKPVLGEATRIIRGEVAGFPEAPTPEQAHDIVDRAIQQVSPPGNVDTETGEIADAPTVPAQPRAQSRRPLPDAFFEAAFDLTKITERLERLTADDRFGQNAEKVAAKHRSDLIRARDALQGVIDRLA